MDTDKLLTLLKDNQIDFETNSSKPGISFQNQCFYDWDTLPLPSDYYKHLDNDTNN